MKKIGRNPDGRQFAILVVEESLTRAEALRHLLEGHGYRVAVAANGKQALAMARQYPPDLMLGANVMPEMGSYALCRAIKSDKRLKDIPVILLSSAQDVIKGLACGADYLVRKPYDENRLLARIHYLLANRDLRRGRKMQKTMPIQILGRRHYLTCQQQMADLLISIYEETVRLNGLLQARQKDLTRSNRTLDGLCRIAESLNRCTREKEVVDRALKCAMELPGVRAGWIFLREGETGFRLAAACNLPPVMEAPGAFERKCRCRRKLLSGELDRATNILECERLQRTKGETGGLRYHASIPLWTGDRTLGVMNLAGEDDRLFRNADLKTLHGVGHQVAIALERARLYEMERMTQERMAALSHQATHDSLTGLPNQALLEDRLQQAIFTGQRENRPLALLVMDLDRFKEVNDTLGHYYGDLLLREIKPRLKGILRATTTVARLGGDEFAILLPGASGEGAKVVAQEILKVLEQPFLLEGQSVTIGASIGIALFPDHGRETDLLLQCADIAMYVAKKSGSGHGFYDPSTSQGRFRFSLE
jgi:diguanylate cyclase (GGDEF)-like protein